MRLTGVDLLARVVEQAGLSAKMVFNANGAILFPISQQHREQKAEGIFYEDDYRGNALAAIVSRGKIEIRYHKAFADEQVAGIIKTLLALPELSVMRGWQVVYQGRSLVV